MKLQSQMSQSELDDMRDNVVERMGGLPVVITHNCIYCSSELLSYSKLKRHTIRSHNIGLPNKIKIYNEVFLKNKKVKVLKKEYEQISCEFEELFGYGDCSCHISTPCSSCTHPGNPNGLEEDDDAWEIR